MTRRYKASTSGSGSRFIAGIYRVTGPRPYDSLFIEGRGRDTGGEFPTRSAALTWARKRIKELEAEDAAKEAPPSPGEP